MQLFSLQDRKIFMSVCACRLRHKHCCGSGQYYYRRRCDFQFPVQCSAAACVFQPPTHRLGPHPGELQTSSWPSQQICREPCCVTATM